jgi:hypothetical protein
MNRFVYTSMSCCSCWRAWLEFKRNIDKMTKLNSDERKRLGITFERPSLFDDSSGVGLLEYASLAIASRYS